MTKRITRGYKFPVLATEEQRTFFSKSFGCSRFVFNHLSGLGIKSDSKQKRGEALRIVSGKPERVIKSTNHETHLL